MLYTIWKTTHVQHAHVTHTAHNIHLTCTVKAYTILTYLEPLVNTILVVVMGTGQEANSLLGFVRAHTHHTPVKCETVNQMPVCTWMYEYFCSSLLLSHICTGSLSSVALVNPWGLAGPMFSASSNRSCKRNSEQFTTGKKTITHPCIIHFYISNSIHTALNRNPGIIIKA